jgi:hypothetical protein
LFFVEGSTSFSAQHAVIENENRCPPASTPAFFHSFLLPFRNLLLLVRPIGICDLPPPMSQCPSTTKVSAAAAPLQSSTPFLAAPQELMPLVPLMRSSHSRAFLPSRPGVHVPPDQDMVIGIIECILDLIENGGGNEEEESKPTRPSSLRGARRQ